MRHMHWMCPGAYTNAEALLADTPTWPDKFYGLALGLFYIFLVDNLTRFVFPKIYNKDAKTRWFFLHFLVPFLLLHSSLL